MNPQIEARKKYLNKLKNLTYLIFTISLSIIIIVNVIYFQNIAVFNLENFLNLLPFNLIGLSITLNSVMVILFNIIKYLYHE